MFVDLVYNHLQQNSLTEKYYDDFYAYDQQELKRWLIFEVKEFERKIAQNAFEPNFKQWYPHISDFMFHQIVNFIERLRLSPEKLFNIVSSQDDFFDIMKSLAVVFNEHYRDVLTYEIDNQVKEILKKKFVNNIMLVSKTFQDFKRTNPKYDVVTLFDQSKLKKLTSFNSIILASTTNQSRQTTLSDKEDWSRIELSKILTKLLTVSADNQRLILKRKLLQWFPQINDSLIDCIIKFLKHQHVGIPNIKKMSSSRQEFFYNFNLNKFILIFEKRQEFEAAIDEQVENLLKQEFKQDGEAIEDVFDEFAASNPNLDLWLLFDDFTLERLLSPFVDKYRLQAPEFNNLRHALNEWFPNDKQINHLFMQYLISQKIPLMTADIISRNRTYFLESSYIVSFAHDHRHAVNEQIYKKIRNTIVASEDSKKAEQIMLYLKDKNFESHFTPKMLYNASLISQLLTDELKKLDMDHCLEEVDRLKVDYPNLKENDCVAFEICSQKKGFDYHFLQKEFQKYLSINISGFSEIEDNNRNIKDEIDETIYDVIQQVLEEKEKNEKSECIVAYLKRNNKIDSFYNPELFFNDQELMKSVKNIVIDYNLFLING